ncbi:MAG: glutamine-hydrolyzing carbamoyl-phosphate synthase small subunit [Candidatus Latescibacteria bacterium]|nr:glutamine-hydrolyzing carbamoyl-phosphate synthase small subunit [Candidatus Latescibacterota bacterium]
MSKKNRKRVMLALENGSVFTGYNFGAEGESTGEVVFNTGMTGYQEILTDPSYHRQIVTMTYPLIGNYGINPEDYESDKPYVAGFVVKEYCPFPSNYRMTETLSDFLARYGIIGIEDIDTRELVRIIREKGAMRGVLSTIDSNHDSLVAKAKAAPDMVGADLVSEITCSEPYYVLETPESINKRKHGLRHIKEYHAEFSRISKDEFDRSPLPLVVAFDYGIKYNILRKLLARDLKIAVVPATMTAQEVLAYNPDGIFLSNGPGDPDAVKYAIETIRNLLGKKPMFGICLGHQLLGLALKGSTFKLKFGHRGENQPVMDTTTAKVEISSQNHGFALTPGSIPGEGSVITHINLNDNTVEGLVANKLKAFSVQYHPESSPGPHDSDYLFDRFLELVKSECCKPAF